MVAVAVRRGRGRPEATRLEPVARGAAPLDSAEKRHALVDRALRASIRLVHGVEEGVVPLARRAPEAAVGIHTERNDPELGIAGGLGAHGLIPVDRRGDGGGRLAREGTDEADAEGEKGERAKGHEHSGGDLPDRVRVARGSRQSRLRPRGPWNARTRRAGRLSRRRPPGPSSPGGRLTSTSRRGPARGRDGCAP